MSQWVRPAVYVSQSMVDFRVSTVVELKGWITTYIPSDTACLSWPRRRPRGLSGGSGSRTEPASWCFDFLPQAVVRLNEVVDGTLPAELQSQVLGGAGSEEPNSLCFPYFGEPFQGVVLCVRREIDPIQAHS